MQTPEQLREHFEIERELADRLRNASREERRALYGTVYRERSERIPHHPLVSQAADAQARDAAVKPQVDLLIPFATRETVFVEVGAGDGAVARGLAPHVKRSIAIDVTDAIAAKEGPANYEFRTFDGFDLGLPAGTVDLAYSNDVAEHLHPDDFRDHCLAVRAALREGAQYICVTPNRLSGPHDVSRHFAETPQGFHLREYTATELARELRVAGFSAVHFLLTYHGRRLTPLLPIRVLRRVEAGLDRLPPERRRRIAHALAAVKVVATA